jgi:hypothetical protein
MTDSGSAAAQRVAQEYQTLASLITCVETGQPCSVSVGWICANHAALASMRVIFDSLVRGVQGSAPSEAALGEAREALKTFGQHRVGCPHPSCPDCGTHTMAASKTPGYSYCTRCGRGSIPTSNEACDCGFEVALARLADAVDRGCSAPPPSPARIEPTHPEAFCDRCGRANAVWFAPSEIWNRAVPNGGILCPVCFIAAAEKAGIQPPAWEIRPERETAPCAIVRFPALPPISEWRWGDHGGPLVSVGFFYEDGTERHVGHNYVEVGAAPPPPEKGNADAR